jgi:hypothetical protein
MDYSQMSGEDILLQVEQGARFVRYSYATSIVIMSFRRESPLYFVSGRLSGMKHALPFLSYNPFRRLVGRPVGSIFTVQALARNLAGGRDVTDEIVNAFV